MKQVLIILSSFFMCVSATLAQQIEVKTITEIVAPSDSAEVFPLEAYVKVVLANHPVIKQADLLPENAREEIRLARGAFDPKLTGNWDVKNYKDTEYYDIFNTTLKVPLWFPVDPKISVDRNRGVYLNPERSIAESEDFRQVTAGLSLPVGRGLLIDQRRAAVQQAELFAQITDAERIKMINKALLSAVKAYWDWYYSYFQFRMVDQSLVISQEIYRRVKVDFELGELAAVDTVQAAITLQNRSTERQAALIQFKRSGLMLSNFLWGENEEPLELQDDVAPRWDAEFTLPEESLDSLLDFAVQNHPELQKLGFKLEQLGVDERLAKENLKPRVDLNYNFINSPINYSGDFTDIALGSNYKFGLEVEFPLFLRKERAKLRQTRIKIDQTSFETQFAQQQILNEVEGAYFEMVNGREMVSLLQQAVSNYERLLEAEIFNLNVGESDLFKINFQQDKLLEAQVKLIKQRVAIEKAKVELLWAAGKPYLNFR
ncbi:TolC family protein [Roseivirga thermotolerans]|uniref:TolC family protein n=1 Tax=Roseivirga thermotolerans TaxID=1758176 RepID=UPI00273ED1B1|nr:TolC family protein [Roseivirga thermotolerans]